MIQTEACLICRKHQGALALHGGAVHADDLIYVGHAAAGADGGQPLLGHFLVEPRRHVPGIADLHRVEAQAVGLGLARTSRAVQTLTGAEHTYIFVLGHYVDHLHVHVVPRYPDTPCEYWGMRVDEWPGAPRGSEQTIILLCEQIHAWLAEERT